MAESRNPRGPLCPQCGQPFRALPEPKRRLLRGDEAALRPLLALCPRCRRRATAARLAVWRRSGEL